jgi:hypothetical protein
MCQNHSGVQEAGQDLVADAKIIDPDRAIDQD